MYCSMYVCIQISAKKHRIMVCLLMACLVVTCRASVNFVKPLKGRHGMTSKWHLLTYLLYTSYLYIYCTFLLARRLLLFACIHNSTFLSLNIYIYTDYNTQHICACQCVCVCVFVRWLIVKYSIHREILV